MPAELGLPAQKNKNGKRSRCSKKGGGEEGAYDETQKEDRRRGEILMGNGRTRGNTSILN